MDAIFVTGNAGKARYFSQLIGLPIGHHSANVDELQSLDLKEIATHKARQAFEQLQKPVIIEDTGLAIDVMGGLPGPFIKWFEQEIGLENVCRLADQDPERKAVASSVYVYFDGVKMHHFEGSLAGTIADHPAGKTGFGWNPIFIPHYSKQTLAEMDEETFKNAYVRIKSIYQLKEFLENI